MKKKIALLVAMLFSFHAVQAQLTKDTLQEVKVKARKKKSVSSDERINTFSPGQKITTIDSITLQQYQFQSIANLLAQQSPAFIKTYGMNGVATLNFRGASAAQSQVYWNGVPLQNAALGMADVSLLPVSLMNKVNIVYGSSAAMWGSGNVGGALVVENEKPYFDSAQSFKHAVYGVAGSFRQYQLGFRSALSTDKWYVSVNAFGQSTLNNFSYTELNERKQMENAKLSSGVGLVQAAYKPDDKQVISFTAWYQQYYREIPRAMFEAQSLKNQRDESLRLLANWSRQGNKTSLFAKLSYMQDNMHYRDTLAIQNSKNTTHQLYAEVGLKYLFKHSQLLLYSPVHIAALKNVITGITNTQNKYALAVSYLLSHFDKKLQIAANARGEIVNDNSFVLPGINLSYQLYKWLVIKANAQYTYRVASLNELYYVPGGNDKLQPEKGWAVDGGYSVKTAETKQLIFNHELSVFNRVIDNWILWFGGAIWTPHNIATVHSRGVETDNNLQYSIGKWKLHTGINTAYVLATTIASNVLNDGSIGKQIPYAPRYNGQVNIGFSYRNVYFNYNHTYTGYRFITVDESQWLMPYNTGNVQLLYTIVLGNNTLQLTAQCNNVWNKQYMVVNARPMPGINWLLGIRFNIN